MAIDNLKLPKARIVSGNPTKWEQASDFHNKQKKLDKNGQPLMQNRVSLAIPKAVFLQEVWPQMIQEVIKVYPHGANLHPDQYLNDRFAWKIIDGDSPQCPQQSKVPYNTREGYAGHYIIKVSTYAFLPETVVFQNGAYRTIQDGQIKTGDYVVCSVKLEVHREKDGGLYWNPNIYELVELGNPIAGGEGGGDPNALLGDASARTHAGFQGALPPAGQQASAMPAIPQMAPGMPMQPQPVPGMPPMHAPAGVPAMPMQPQPVPGMPSIPAQPQPVPGMPQAYPTQPIQPAHDFVQNAMGVPQHAPVGVPAIPQQPYGAPGGPVGQYASTPQPSVPQMAPTTALPATSYPSNPQIPGMPQPR
jgi:hypothetical protein